MDDSLLFELLTASKPEEKAAIVAEFIISKLSAETSLVARRCCVLHWFDETIVEVLLKDIPNTEGKANSIYEQIRSLPFVESLPWGLTFNSLTREGLLYRYTATQPELLRIAAQLAAPVYRVHIEDRKTIAEAFFCYVVAGETTLALELLDQLVEAWS